jgi:Na+-translocating ferredoxin:NAD+ oxidoreductase RnfE subunit
VLIGKAGVLTHYTAVIIGRAEVFAPHGLVIIGTADGLAVGDHVRAASVLVEWLRRFMGLGEAERLGRELTFPRDDESAVAAARAALSRGY